MRLNCQPARGFHDRGEFQLHTCQRKSQDSLLLRLVIRVVIIMAFVVDIMALPVQRPDRNCSGDVGAQDGH